MVLELDEPGMWCWCMVKVFLVSPIMAEERRAREDWRALNSLVLQICFDSQWVHSEGEVSGRSMPAGQVCALGNGQITRNISAHLEISAFTIQGFVGLLPWWWGRRGGLLAGKCICTKSDHGKCWRDVWSRGRMMRTWWLDAGVRKKTARIHPSCVTGLWVDGKHSPDRCKARERAGLRHGCLEFSM